MTSSAPAGPGWRTAVVGGGPAGLMAAEVLATGGAHVTVHERMPSVGRKLLVAGRGGLNLTHTEPLDAFLDRYGPARGALESAVRAFDADALRAWAAELGESPFVGSSGRVFPAGFRATPLLRAWLHRLAVLGVVIETRRTWLGWGHDEHELVFHDGRSDRDGDEHVVRRVDAAVLALGGASWPRTGSNGAWAGVLATAGIAVEPLRPANAGVEVAWSAVFAERYAGSPLKDVVVSIGDATARGDVVVTSAGLEGGAIYAVGRTVREALDRSPGRPEVLRVDLRPDRTVDELAAHLVRRRPKDSATTALRRAGLAPVAVGLLREVTGNALPSTPQALAGLIKAVPVEAVALRPIERAISTAGGIAWSEVDERLMLRHRPGTFVAGEMLDWEAPTGGYLLQGALATGVAAARGALAWLDRDQAAGTG